MFQFGSGYLFANPSGGNLAANPTPVRFATLQDVSIDISQDLKELRGQSKYADDVAPSDIKITGKATFGRIDIDIFNNLFFADTRITGIKQIQPLEPHAVPATSPYTVTVTNSANFLTDLGVTYAATGQGLARVSGSPAQGQYAVSAGVYTFSAADEGAAVLISYDWTSSASGKTIQINSQIQGYGPVFEIYLAEPYQQVGGLNNGMHFYCARASKLSLALKRTDYLIPDFEFSCFANAAGAVGELFQVAV